MDYFNRALDNNAYQYVPRKNKITEEEILKFWIPGKNKNMSVVADVNGKVVGSGTVLFDVRSNIHSIDS